MKYDIVIKKEQDGYYWSYVNGKCMNSSCSWTKRGCMRFTKKLIEYANRESKVVEQYELEIGE